MRSPRLSTIQSSAFPDWRGGTWATIAAGRTTRPALPSSIASSKSRVCPHSSNLARILAAPKIEPFTFRTDLAEGEGVRQTCFVSAGDPPMLVDWFRDGDPLESSELVRITRIDPVTSVLAISSLTATMAGNYTCVAKNEVAMVEEAAVLVVRGLYSALHLVPDTCYSWCRADHFAPGVRKPPLSLNRNYPSLYFCSKRTTFTNPARFYFKSDLHFKYVASISGCFRTKVFR